MSSNQFIKNQYINIAPDYFNNDNHLKSSIQQGFIMSRKPNGEVKSVYSDNIWDFTAYSVDPCKFYFENNSQHVLFPDTIQSNLVDCLRKEMKFITFLLMNAPEIRSMGHRSPPYKIQSFTQTFSLVKKLTKTAMHLGISLYDAAEHKQFYIALCSSVLNLSRDSIGKLLFFIMQLRALNESGYIGVPTIVSNHNYEHFVSLVKNIRAKKNNISENSIERTPLIPTRILSNLIVDSMDHISEIKPYLGQLIAFFEEYQANPHFWCTRKNSFRKDNNPHGILWDKNKMISPQDAIDKYELTSFIEKFPISSTLAKYNIQVLIGTLSKTQAAARLLCHAFSGMRYHEINVLPFNTLEKLKINGIGDVPFLRSYTSKIGQNNYSKPTYWVTSPELESAIEVAQKIAEIAAIKYDTNCSRDSNFPLFPSLFASTSDKDNHIHYQIPLIAYVNPLLIITHLISDIKITEEDLKELELFDIFRNWRSDKKFSIGNNWPISPHQFRRSLAVYASRSGLVSLPSLSTHYKHMTLAMTALYAENSAFAVNMINEDEDESHREQKLLVDEFVFHQRLNQAINLDQKVLQTSNRLTGGMGSRIQRLKDTESLPIWLTDRIEIEKRVQDGRLHYRETMVGGCMNPSPCKKSGLGGVSPCTNCEFSIFDGDNGEKNQAYKESLELSIEYMEPNTPAYTAVMADIERISFKQLDTEEEL